MSLIYNKSIQHLTSEQGFQAAEKLVTSWKLEEKKKIEKKDWCITL